MAAASAPGEAPPPSLRAAAPVLAVLLTIYALAYLDRQIITLLVDPIRRDLAVTDVQISFLQGLAFVLFYTVCGLPIGLLVDRYSRRLIIFIGVIVWSLSCIASGFADTYRELLIARFGVGAGEAALLPAAYSIISDAVDRRRLSSALAVFSLGAIVGGSLALAVGGGLVEMAERAGPMVLPAIGEVASWQLVFLIVGAAGIPLSLLAFLIPRLERSRSEPAPGEAPRERAHFRRHARFYILHIAAFSLFCLLMAANGAWSPTFLIRELGWPVDRVGFVLGAVHMVGGAAGMLGGGMLADRLVRAGYRDAHLRLYLFALPVISGSAIAAYTAGSVPVALIGLTVVSIGGPFIAVAAAALQLGTPPENRGFASAVFLFFYNLVGFGLGPTVAAYISETVYGPQGDIGAALAVTFAVVSPVAVLLLWLGMKPMRVAVAEVEARTPTG